MNRARPCLRQLAGVTEQLGCRCHNSDKVGEGKVIPQELQV